MAGWVTQMIFGVTYWMFPILSRAKMRGDERPWRATFVLLNAGLLLRVAGKLLVLSALFQWLAALLFLFITWPRVRGKPGWN